MKSLMQVTAGGYLFLCMIGTGNFAQDSTVVLQTVAKQEAQPLVLIAWQESIFKQAVVQKIKMLLEEDGAAVTLVDIEQLSNQSTEHYHVIVIVNEIRAWHLSPDAAKYLRHLAAEQRKKVVLVSTAKGNAKFTKKIGVDALTTASEIDQVPVVATRAVEKISAVIASQKQTPSR